MKRFIQNLSLPVLILLTVTFSTKAQMLTSTVGTYSYYTYNLPLYTCYGYNLSEMIYPSDVLSDYGITGPVSIHKLRYYLYITSTDPSKYKDFVIYMGNTSKSSYSSGTDWIKSGSMTKVFDGTVTISSSTTGWVEFDLDVPFEYTGGNLVIALDENTSGYSCTAAWIVFYPYGTSSSTNLSLLYYDDYTNPNPASPPSASSYYTFSPYIQLVYTNCASPTSISTSVTTNSAIINWTTSPAVSTVEIEYGESGFTPGSGTTFYGTSSPDTITGLIPNTKYDFYIRQNCAGGANSSWVHDSFTTNCQIPSVISTINDSVCDHGIMNLKAFPSTYATINWYDDITSTTPIATGSTFTTPDLSTSTYYYATATVGNMGSCESSKVPVLAKVNPLPVFSITPPVDTVCEGVQVTYSATYDPDYTYYWSTGDTSRVVTFDEAGTYYLTVTDEKGCSDMDSIRLVNFLTVSADGFDYIPMLFEDPFTVKFSVINPISVFYYYWDFGDGTTSVEPTPVHTYPGPGKYNVTMVVRNDCGTDTQKLKINVTKPTSVDDDIVSDHFKIYPNPAVSFLNIESKMNTPIQEIKIYNAIGQLIISQAIDNQIAKIDVSRLPQGSYLVVVESEQGNLTKKFSIK